mmetsp:Transcript_51998/g.161091  ORF Transcript_51998/g.161091 Transcript_51998/m.161091 type:complete len:506 (+) Transcript_51998:132-1649(+)
MRSTAAPGRGPLTAPRPGGSAAPGPPRAPQGGRGCASAARARPGGSAAGAPAQWVDDLAHGPRRHAGLGEGLRLRASGRGRGLRPRGRPWPGLGWALRRPAEEPQLRRAVAAVDAALPQPPALLREPHKDVVGLDLPDELGLDDVGDHHNGVVDEAHDVHDAANAVALGVEQLLVVLVVVVREVLQLDALPPRLRGVSLECVHQQVHFEAQAQERPVLKGEAGEERLSAAHVADTLKAEDVQLLAQDLVLELLHQLVAILQLLLCLRVRALVAAQSAALLAVLLSHLGALARVPVLYVLHVPGLQVFLPLLPLGPEPIRRLHLLELPRRLRGRGPGQPRGRGRRGRRVCLRQRRHLWRRGGLALHCRGRTRGRGSSWGSARGRVRRRSGLALRRGRLQDRGLRPRLGLALGQRSPEGHGLRLGLGLGLHLGPGHGRGLQLGSGHGLGMGPGHGLGLGPGHGLGRHPDHGRGAGHGPGRGKGLQGRCRLRRRGRGWHVRHRWRRRR